MLAFFALSNADVLIARSVLDNQQSGLYAAGLILSKAVLFLPQFVVVIAFPSMSEAGQSRRVHAKGFALVLAIGVTATLGAWMLADLAVTFVGGSAYTELEPRIAVFAAVGTVLALVQLMVYSVVARQTQRMVLVIWAGLLVLLASAAVVGSVGSLLSVVISVEGTVLAVLLAVSIRRPALQPDAAAGQKAAV
jgi:O-antigen/teichoic acid export membrane protein